MKRIPIIPLGVSGLAAFLGANTEILKPLADYRDFRHFQMSNGMDALAIHHPRSNEAAFAVAVKTGSFYDPPQLPGLAHFLEHMLFLGTEKYPQAGDYDSFLTGQGGANNAYTDEERTVFFNKVTDAGLEEALDRFSEFFKTPLFNREYEEKEINAVNAEHQKNLPNDDERTWFAIRSQAKGPMSQFSTGNTETLSTRPKSENIDVVARLRDFHQQYYCGANMVAVTMSPRSLDEQESLIKKNFEGVSAGHPNWLGMVQCPGPSFNTVKPFDSTNTGKFVHLQSFSNEPSLWIAFGMQPTLTSYKKQPVSVLTYMLEYNGEGSISRRLKLLDLADSISVVADRNSVCTLLGMKVELTQKGARHRGLVLQEIFAYINFLRDHGISHDVVSSLAELSRIDFHTTQPNSSTMDEVARIAHNLLTYEPYHVMAGDTLLVDSDPRLVNNLLQQMSPSKAIIAFSDPNFTSTVQNYQTEPNYGIQYKVLDLPTHQAVAMAVLTATPTAFLMPPALRHIPTSQELEILPKLEGLTEPILLSDELTEGPTIWWQGQGELPLPKVAVRLVGRTAKAHADLLTTTQGAVLFSSLSEFLLEDAVDFQNCGISHSLSFGTEGFQMSFEGYTTAQVQSLMDLVAEKISTPTFVSEERFYRVKKRQIKMLSNPATSLVYEHAMEAAQILTRNDKYSRQDILNALKEVTYDNSMAKIENLKEIHVDVFIMGNINRDDSVNIVESFMKKSGFKSILRRDSKEAMTMEQKQTIETTLANPIKGDKDHATLLQYQLGIPTIDERVNLSVISQLINRKLYDNLRTQAQLGYIVGARESISASTNQLQCFVEGSKEHPNDVAAKIEETLKSAREHITKMPDSEFQHWKASMLAKLSGPDANFVEQFDKAWNEIYLHADCFAKKKLELKYLEKEFSTQRILHTLTKLLEPSKKLVVKLVANLDPAKEITLIGAPSTTDASMLQGKGNDSKAKPMKLLSLEDKFVSPFQIQNGFFPNVAVCELPSTFISEFELLEGF